jgi:peptidylprolyl isomerase
LLRIFVVKALVAAMAVWGALAFAGCGGGDSSAGPAATTEASTAETKAVATVQGPEPKVSVPKGAPPKQLAVKDLKVGSGEEAEIDDDLAVQFIAVRYDGEPFESSWESGKPFDFTLNSEQVSPGWVRGIPGMKVGGRRELIVPPNLISRYGVPPGTGPEATLVYVIDLLEIK